GRRVVGGGWGWGGGAGRGLGGGAGAVGVGVWRPGGGAARGARAEGTVVLFQGDSITDGGRNRAASEPNQPGGLGSSYPLLVASAALAAHPDRALKFYNRGVSGNKVPDLAQRCAADTLELRPAGVRMRGG